MNWNDLYLIFSKLYPTLKLNNLLKYKRNIFIKKSQIT